jgi:PAS domain-containing protein
MREFGRGRSHHGSFIVDGRGTILGFDQALEELTGWPAIEIVGHGKDLGMRASTQEPGGMMRTVPLYEGQVPTDGREGNLVLFLNCRDGRRLDVEARTRPLEGPGSRVHLTVLRVLASSRAELGLPDHASRDELTGLPDREAFSAQLATDRCWRRSAASCA